MGPALRHFVSRLQAARVDRPSAPVPTEAEMRRRIVTLIESDLEARIDERGGRR